MGMKKKKKKLLQTPLWPHNPPPKKLTHDAKPILGPAQLSLEQIMLICGLHLSLSDRLDGRVLRSAHGTFCVLVDCVQAALVEGVFA